MTLNRAFGDRLAVLLWYAPLMRHGAPAVSLK